MVAVQDRCSSWTPPPNLHRKSTSTVCTLRLAPWETVLPFSFGLTIRIGGQTKFGGKELRPRAQTTVESPVFRRGNGIGASVY